MIRFFAVLVLLASSAHAQTFIAVPPAQQQGRAPIPQNRPNECAPRPTDPPGFKRCVTGRVENSGRTKPLCLPGLCK